MIQIEKWKIEYKEKKVLEKNEISRTHPVYSFKITDFCKNTLQQFTPIEVLLIIIEKGKLINLVETSTVLAKKRLAFFPSNLVGIEHLVSIANV